MPDHPRFSVLIPCFNAAPYLGATLDSVRKQGHPSVEVIVMDGGSTDGTVELVRNYRGLRIVWESGPDRGQLEAVQKAACRASGDILYWLNADDILMPGSLAAVDATFAADPELDLVYSDNFAFDETRRILVNGGLIKGLTLADHVLFYRQMYSECIFWRREATSLLPESDFDLRLCTDYAFFLNLRAGLKERWLAKRLGAFRIREGQISATHGERHALEFARIRSDAYSRLGWSKSSIHFRKAAHWPSFALRQRLRPAAAAAKRALRRLLDGGARRRELSRLFFDEWLHGNKPASDLLIRQLWR